MVYRIFVEKKIGLDNEAKGLLNEARNLLGIENLNDIRLFNRYDAENITEELFDYAVKTVFSEPQLDNVSDSVDIPDAYVFAVEALPGQFDQRADSAAQCIQIISQGERPLIRTAKVYALYGTLTDADISAFKNHVINAVESREAALELPETLVAEYAAPETVATVEGFVTMDESALATLLDDKGLAMDLDDLKFLQAYFRDTEHRDPTITEIRVVDTYWSDHCRHTTFSTHLDNVRIDDPAVQEAYERYLAARVEVYGEEKAAARPQTLMDIATIGTKTLKKRGLLPELDESEEINACSIHVTATVNGEDQDWLLMFKNETHNHPTEIEPFGGAATCIGGCIRDPLSGRAYVHQAMRVTGAGDPRKTIAETLDGKLPQRKICQTAAAGYSSYGNQIGLATGHVAEIYHEGFVAKRLECGAVVAAAPAYNVRRERPAPGDVIVLLGGRTGRDGIGGATGSSKSHELKTTTTAGAEVQKGNPIEERKIQRLFRNKSVSEKIIRCNDFGAGGVCVAVGELAPGLEINLDAVLKKYEGLNGTELAISESQERMAIVIEAKDEEFIKNECFNENLEVVKIATVTSNNRLVMKYLGQTIVDINRSFLDKNGASRYQNVTVELPDFSNTLFDVKACSNFKDVSTEVLSRLSVCSQKGLVEMFDSSIGNNTVLSPYGGKTLRTETEGMAALIPVLGKETTTCSIMSYGFNPEISKWSPYHGAIYAVVESVAKIIAMGGDYHKIRFSFQEYFEKLLDNPIKWGKPFAALLGAYKVQKELNLPSIGGKDSMSGSFENLDVPPTLVSFAITAADVKDIVTPELKCANHLLVEVMLEKDKYNLFNFESLKATYDKVSALIKDKQVYSAYTVKDGGVIEAVYKMAFGNEIGVKLNHELTLDSLVQKDYGNIILEVENNIDLSDLNVRIIGQTLNESKVVYNDLNVELDEAYDIYKNVLNSVYPQTEVAPTTDLVVGNCSLRTTLKAKQTYDEVNVVIPVFPGTNCEYDSKRAFEKAGAKVELVVIRNKTEQDIKNSISDLVTAINKAQIMMLPGGFSAGDEPEGSGKFIATFLRNEKIKEAITDLLENRDGLMIGICNGFQALIKLGLLPYGKISDMTKDDATLTFNTIGRHVSQMVNTKIASVKSPWLNGVNVGDIHTIPVSHGEGRFVAPANVLEELFKNGQVFTQYVDEFNNPTMQSPYNPNGSMMAIEGIISIDGRVIGKMGHSERQGDNRFINIYGEMDQKLFESGVNYFKK